MTNKQTHGANTKGTFLEKRQSQELEAQAKYLLDCFKKSSKFCWGEAKSERYQYFIEALCLSGLMGELPELSVVKDKYVDWYLSGCKATDTEIDFSDIDLDQLPSELKNSVNKVQSKLASGYYRLSPQVEIIDAIQKSYPLVGRLQSVSDARLHKVSSKTIAYLLSKTNQ